MRAESKQQMKGKKVVKPTPSHWASNQSIAAWRAEQQSPRRSPRQQRQFGAGFDIPNLGSGLAGFDPGLLGLGARGGGLGR